MVPQQRCGDQKSIIQIGSWNNYLHFLDVKSAQKFLGHADLQVTLKIYTHLSEGKEQAAVDALNKYFSDDGAPRSFGIPNRVNVPHFRNVSSTKELLINAT